MQFPIIQVSSGTSTGREEIDVGTGIIVGLFGFLILTEVIYIEIRLRQQISIQKQITEKLDVLIEEVKKR